MMTAQNLLRLTFVCFVALVTLLASAYAQGDNLCRVLLSVDDGLAFKPNRISVPGSCSKFEITVRHDGRLPKIASPRNWVLAAPDQVNRVVRDGVLAGQANGWLQSESDAVIAHTPVIGRNESAKVSVSVSDLEPDVEYVFLSTIPGVSPVLRGKLMVVGAKSNAVSGDQK